MAILGERIKPETEGQKQLVDALTDKDCEIVGTFGPTGTGKSLLTIAYGIDAVLTDLYKRLLICKPIIDVVTGKEVTIADVGFETYSEMALQYVKDILCPYVSWQELKKLVEDGKIMFVDTHYLRGRTFDNVLILLDDAQSIPPETACEVLMRVGQSTKFVVAGDPVFQKDPRVEKDGATLMREILLGEPKARVIDLGLKDIVRPGAKRGIRMLLELRMRKRVLSEEESKVLESVKVHSPDADVVTVIEFSKEKEVFEIKSEQTPDSLIIAKEGYMGRVIGKGGERIRKIEEDTGKRVRVVELTLDFRPWIRAIHPVAWTHKYIQDMDFAGPELAIYIEKEGFGPFVGQKGFHVKFIDAVFKRLMGVGVRAFEVEESESRRRRRK